jgi:hypothetical protein
MSKQSKHFAAPVKVNGFADRFSRAFPVKHTAADFFRVDARA